MSSIYKIFTATLIVSLISACSNSNEQLKTSIDPKKEKSFTDTAPAMKYRFAANDLDNHFFSTTEFKEHKNPEEWNLIDASIRQKIDNHINLDGFSLCIQHTACSFLDKYLLKAENSKERNEAIRYYLGVLRHENNNYWPLLTEGLLNAKNSIPVDEFEAYKVYILSDANKYKAANASRRLTKSNDPSSLEYIESLDDAENCVKKLEREF